MFFYLSYIDKVFVMKKGLDKNQDVLWRNCEGFAFPSILEHDMEEVGCYKLLFICSVHLIQ